MSLLSGGMLGVLCLTCLLASWPALAQVVYRYVDKDGRVVLSDRPPAQGPFERIEPDTSTNVIQSPRRSSDQVGPPGNALVRERQQRRDTLRAAVDAARKRLEAAQAALQSGKDPKEGEWRPVQVPPDNQGRPNSQGQVTALGGKVVCPVDPYGRPVCVSGNSPNEEYFKRLDSLEAEVRKAEAALHAAEQNYRRNAPD